MIPDSTHSLGLKERRKKREKQHATAWYSELTPVKGRLMNVTTNMEHGRASLRQYVQL